MLKDRPLCERVSLAEQLRGFRGQIAERVTEEFLRHYPGWVTRYGERARLRGVEDANFHQDFLAAAIETGEPQAYADYLRWASVVLESRGIEPRFLHENVDQIAEELAFRLSGPMAEDLAEFVKAAMSAALTGGAEDLKAVSKESELGRIQGLYLQAILHGQRQAAVSIAVEAVRQGQSVVDIYADVLQESLYEVGRLWVTNRITVATEHMATAITQHVIAHLYPLVESAQPARGRMVITGVEGEHHQVGPNMVADVLESAGWDVRFLGANVPTASVAQAMKDHNADVLGISATMLSSLPGVRKLIEAVRAIGDREVKIILGGRAFSANPALYKELGAVGVAGDIREALRLAKTL